MPSRPVPSLLSSRTELQFCSWEAEGLRDPAVLGYEALSKVRCREAGIVASGSCFRFLAFKIAVNTRWAAMTTQVLLTSSWHASKVADGVFLFQLERGYTFWTELVGCQVRAPKIILYVGAIFVTKIKRILCFLTHCNNISGSWKSLSMEDSETKIRSIIWNILYCIETYNKILFDIYIFIFAFILLLSVSWFCLVPSPAKPRLRPVLRGGSAAALLILIMTTSGKLWDFVITRMNSWLNVFYFAGQCMQ